MADLRDAWRSLRSTPVVTAAAILSLALGIGANTAIFSLVNAVMLRPLAVPHPAQLVVLASGERPNASWRQAVWIEVRDRQLLDGAFAWFWNRMNTAQAGEKQFVNGMAATGGMFTSLGVRPHIGRLLTPADDRAGTDGAVAVISYRFWQQRFGATSDVLQKTLTLEGRAFTIVGVTPPSFAGLYIGLPFDVAIPLAADARAAPYVTVMGRLRPGHTAATATARLRAAQAQIRDATNPYTVSPYREDYLREPFTVHSAAEGVSALRQRYQKPLGILLGIVALVLLVACGTLATVLLARTMARRRELSIRAALGASRARLVRHQVTESLILAMAGMAAGLLFAQWGSHLVVAQLSTQAYTVSLDVSPDWRVLVFTAGVGLLTAVLTGAASAWRATRADPLAVQVTRDRRAAHERAGNLTVAAQVAVSVVLLVLTGLFLRTFNALNSAPTGFDRERVLIATIDAANDAAVEKRRALYRQLVESVAGAVDVESAGVSLAMPGGNNALAPWVELSDGTKLPQGMHGGVFANRVSSEWFGTLGSALLAGRGFRHQDTFGTTNVAIVNRSFVRRFLEGQQPLGQMIFERGSGPDGARHAFEIVGIVEDAMYVALKDGPPPTIYTPIAQMASAYPGPVFLSVRARGGDPRRLSQAVADAIARVDPALSVSFRTLRDQVEAQYVQERLVATISTFFGGLAVLLAALGLYAVVSFAATQRTFEIALRLALGAQPAGLVRTVFARVTASVSVGLVGGLVLSLWAGSFVGAILYRTDSRDPATLGIAAAVMLAIAVIAAWLPARRVIQTDPAQVLREV